MPGPPVLFGKSLEGGERRREEASTRSRGLPSADLVQKHSQPLQFLSPGQRIIMIPFHCLSIDRTIERSGKGSGSLWRSRQSGWCSSLATAISGSIWAAPAQEVRTSTAAERASVLIRQGKMVFRVFGCVQSFAANSWYCRESFSHGSANRRHCGSGFCLRSRDQSN
jgi:hypothetical protein